jgi:hypothetical protein
VNLRPTVGRQLLLSPADRTSPLARGAVRS